MEISKCKINEKNHLVENDKLVVVQIGRHLFCLDHLRKIKNLDELSETISKYSLVLLKEGE